VLQYVRGVFAVDSDAKRRKNSVSGARWHPAVADTNNLMADLYSTSAPPPSPKSVKKLAAGRRTPHLLSDLLSSVFCVLSLSGYLHYCIRYYFLFPISYSYVALPLD
jgi:hypothetical protein